MVGISAVTTNSPAVSFASRRDIPRPPSGRDRLVATGDQVAPRRRAVKAVVDRRAQTMDVRAPDRQVLGALVGFEPHAAHLGLDLARPVGAHAAARTVAQRLGARHRAGEAGVVQDALAAHPAVPDRPLDRVLDGLEQAHAGTRARRSSMSALAFFTAEEASAETPSAPPAAASPWATGGPPTMTITSSRMPALSSALMFALNIGIVVVRNAEKPTMSGWCSPICSTNFSGGTFTPRSITVKPAPSSMMLQRFLPMSWTSPLTVPMRNVPT